jgi:hypothetical protein
MPLRPPKVAVYPMLRWSGGGPADAIEASQSCGVPNVAVEWGRSG